MLLKTIRFKEKFYTGWDEYNSFPFDTLQFKMRFELDQFTLNDKGELAT